MFEWMFKLRNNYSSYKFIFFQSILDCIGDDRKKTYITFDEIFGKFVEISWPIVLKHRIRQNKKRKDDRITYLEQILLNFLHSELVGEYSDYTELSILQKEYLVKKVKAGCKHQVVGSFFGDTRELLYSFNVDCEWIKINPYVIDFLIANRTILENLNILKWAEYYYKENSEETNARIEQYTKQLYLNCGINPYKSIIKQSLDNRLQYENTWELLKDALELEEKISLTEEDFETMETELFSEYEKLECYLTDPELLIKKIIELKRTGVS